MKHHHSSTISEPHVFPVTRWSLIEAAKKEEEDAARALNTLCEAYWYPVYAYVRRIGHKATDAEDLTQEFFARFLKKGYFCRAVQKKGRLRNFILSSLKRFLTDEHRRNEALKRGAGHIILSIDEQQAENRFENEPNHNLSPDLVFQRRWVSTLLNRVMGKLEIEWRNRGRDDEFKILEQYIPWNSVHAPQENAALRLGVSVQTVRKGVFRLRRRFYSILKEEIVATVFSDAEVEEELKALRTIFEE